MKTIRKFHSANLLFFSLEENHLPLIHELHSRPLVAQFNTIGIPESQAATAKVLSQRFDPTNPSNMGWAIFDRKNAFLGEAGLVLAPKRFKKAEISYSLLPEHWNKGLGTEVVQTLLQNCFQHLDLHRVEAGVAVKNAASIRVLEKAGMRREGTHIKILPLSTGWSDNYSYALLKEEWERLNGHR